MRLAEWIEEQERAITIDFRHESYYRHNGEREKANACADMAYCRRWQIKKALEVKE